MDLRHECRVLLGNWPPRRSPTRLLAKQNTTVLPRIYKSSYPRTEPRSSIPPPPLISAAQKNRRQNRSEPYLKHSVAYWTGPNRLLPPLGPGLQTGSIYIHGPHYSQTAKLCVGTWISRFSLSRTSFVQSKEIGLTWVLFLSFLMLFRRLFSWCSRKLLGLTVQRCHGNSHWHCCPPRRQVLVNSEYILIREQQY